MAAVVLTAEAREDLRDLDGGPRKLVLKALKKLEDEPTKRGEPLGHKQGGNLTGFRKLYVDDRQYRVVYRVEPDGSVAVVWVVGSRVDERCYELAMARVKLYSQPAMAEQLQEIVNGVWKTTAG